MEAPRLQDSHARRDPQHCAYDRPVDVPLERRLDLRAVAHLAWKAGEVSVSASTSRVGRYTARKIIISGLEKAVAVYSVRAVN